MSVSSPISASGRSAPASAPVAQRVGLGLLEPGSLRPEEGLRASKKRLTRQRLTDTATQLFLERGFEETTIADVAAECGVSEKTVWNYFPVKETLLLDVEDATADALRREIGGGGSPVAAVLRVLELDLRRTSDYLVDDPAAATATILRFQHLVDSVASLSNYYRGMLDRLSDTAAASLAEGRDVDVTAPETQIVAVALIGLMRVQLQVIQRLVAAGTAPQDFAQQVRTEVARAADIIHHALDATPWATSGT